MSDTALDSRLQLLLQLVESITASPDLDQVLDRVVRSASSLVEGSRSTLWIVEGARLVARARFEPPRQSSVPSRSEFELGEGLAGHAALERRTLLIPDVLADSRTANPAYHEAEGLRACAAVPLISHGRLVGVLELLTSRAADLGATEVEMLTAFGGHAAVAIESARLYADAERRRREAEILADIARDLAGQHDLDAILGRIARRAHALCASDVTCLALRDADGSFPSRFTIGARSEAYPKFRVRPGLGIGGRAVVDGRPARAAERLAWPPLRPEDAAAIDAEGIRSALVVPIVVDGTIDGLLYVSSRSPHAFGDADESLLVRLADHAAAAIHTGRLFAAEQAARSEAENLVDTLDAIVLDADAETFRISFVNKRAEAILGYPVDRWYEDPDFWVRHVHPDDRDAAASACRQAIADDRDHVLQYRMVAADGRVVWMHDMVRILPCGADGTRRLRSVMVDISDRKRAEAVLAKEREILALIAAGTPTSNVLDAICRLFESLSTDVLAAVVLPESKRRELTVLHGLRACWASPVLDGRGEVIATFVLYRRVSGTPRPEEMELVASAAHLIRIVHERDRATLALQRSEEEHRALVSHIPAMTWMADAGLESVFVSPNSAQVTGFTPEELVAAGPKGWFARIHPDDVAAVRERYEALTLTRRPYDIDYRLRHRSGDWIWIRDCAMPAWEREGVVHFAGVMIDITARKEAELEIQQQRQMLTHLTRAATLGELSGALAHELNQPLTAILANAAAGLRLLEREPADLAEVREILQDILNDDRRAGDVIHRMRALLRRSATPRQPLDVNEVTTEVLRLLQSELIISGVAVTAEMADALPRVDGDRVGLQQVLLNLILNACDAMRAADPAARRITVTTSWDRNRAVHVTIADCGSGLPAEDPERVFEPFFTTKTHGLGLGLVICRSIVAAHGGTLVGWNNPDRGATFTVALPAAGRP